MLYRPLYRSHLGQRRGSVKLNRVFPSSTLGRNIYTLPTMSNDEEEDVSYGNTHRAFLQALLARQTITFEESKPLLAAIQTAADADRSTLPGDISQADFENHIHTLNAHISPFDFEIRSSQHQVSKERIYALVNTISDPLTQMATIHSADEIAFVKRVLDAMFETYNTPRSEVMAATSMQALKLAKAPNDGTRRESGTQATSQNAGLTMAQAEKMLEDMVSEGWFELSGKGFYTLSPRALMELREWLPDTYNYDDEEEDEEEESHVKIKKCNGCSEIVTVGQRCPNMACQIRVHDYCKVGMFAIEKSERCPKCKTAWVQAPPVGEKADRSARSSNVNGVRTSNANGARMSNVNGGGRRRSGGMGVDGADDEDSDASGGAE